MKELNIIYRYNKYKNNSSLENKNDTYKRIETYLKICKTIKRNYTSVKKLYDELKLKFKFEKFNK